MAPGHEPRALFKRWLPRVLMFDGGTRLNLLAHKCAAAHRYDERMPPEMVPFSCENHTNKQGVRKEQVVGDHLAMGNRNHGQLNSIVLRQLADAPRG
ncbi:hypothetical protein CVV67_10680 [Arthrobacter stackebrandtii]|nr:hypothetical protein CVV67_10680 [Arthrobacter stackebrandtii]